MPELNDVTQTLKDAAYITVGLGVMGFQKAAVLRNDVAKQLTAERTKLEARFNTDDVKSAVDAQMNEVRTQVAKATKDAEARFEPVQAAIEAQLDKVEERLPEQVKAVVQQARTAAKDAQAQLRTVLVPAA